MIKLKFKYGNSQTDLRFPCTEKEMNAALERIHAEDITPLELYTDTSAAQATDTCDPGRAAACCSPAGADTAPAAGSDDPDGTDR